MTPYEELKKRLGKGESSGSETSGKKSAVEELRERLGAKRFEEDVRNVDSSYIDRFVSSANSYFGSAGEAFDKVGWGNATQAYLIRRDSFNDLDYRRSVIQKWMENNREQMDLESYRSFYESLENFGVDAPSILDSFSGARDFYNQFETEDDYLAYLDYQEKSKFDLAAGQKEIDDLKAKRDEMVRNRRPPANSYLTGNTSMASSPYGAARQQGTEQEKALAELNRDISRKSQYLNQSRNIQDGIAMAGVTENADFGKYSGYQSTELEGTWDRATSKLGMGYGDLTYEFINGGDTGVRDAIIKRAITLGNFDQKVFAYAYMTEDQIAIYNYHYAKEGREAAEKYLNSIQESLNYKLAEARFGQMKDKTGLEMLFGIEAGLDQFKTGISSFFNTKDDYIPQTAVQMASGMVREDLKTAGPNRDGRIGGVLPAHIGYDVITTTTNMAPSMLTSMAVGMINPAAGAIAGNALMFASSAGNAYQDALNRGYDKGQARMYSALVGGSEVGLQYFLGGISSLGGKVSGKTINAMLEGVDNAFLRFAGKLGGSMVSEGIEEGLQEILTPMFENMVLYADTDINWEEVTYSFLLGSLTAGFMEGPSTVNSAVNTHNTNREMKNIYGSDPGALVSDALEIDPENAFAQKMRERLDMGKDLSGGQINRLVQQNEAAMTAQDMSAIQSAAAQRLAELGETGDVDTIADALARQAAGEELSRAEERAVRNSKYGQRVANELNTENIQSAGYASGWAEQIGTNRINAQEYGRIVKAPQDELETATVRENRVVAKNATGKESLPVSKKETTTQGVSEDGVTRQMSTGKEVTPQKIVAIDGGKVMIQTDGGTIAADDIEFGTGDTALLWRSAASFNGINTSGANGVIRAYQSGTPVTTYLQGAAQEFQNGYYNMESGGEYADKLTPTQREIIYDLGQKAAGENTAKALSKATAAKKQQGTDSKTERVGDVHFDRKGRTFDSVREVSLKAMEQLSKTLGVEFYVYESYVNEAGERVYKDARGNEVHAPNGWYDPKDGSIHIDLNAGAEGRGTMLFTIAHELTHFIKEWSPAKFKVLANFLVKQYGEEGVSVNKLVDAQIAKAKRSGRELSWDEAYEEMVADSMEVMLTDGNVVQMMAELKQQDKNLWQKICDWFKDLVADLKAIVDAYNGVKPDSHEGKLVSQMQDVIVVLESLYTDAMTDASENYQAARAEKNTTREGSDKQYSMRDVDIERSYIDYTDFRKIDSVITEKVTDLIGRKKVTKLLSDAIQNYDRAVDWSDRKAARELLKKILNPHIGESVSFELEGQFATAYLTRDGIDHSVGGLASSRKAAAFDSYASLVKNAEYAYSTKNDRHSNENKRIGGKIDWDCFVSVAMIGTEEYPVVFKIRTIDQDLRSQIYEISAKKETGYSRGDGHQNDPVDVQPSYGVTPISKDRLAQQNIEVKEKFSLREPVEYTKNLVAPHNLTEDKLANAMEYAKFSDLDSNYMQAVNRGDMETVQKMVDEAAERWGAYRNNDEANEVFHQDGRVRIFYHGTNTGDFTAFDSQLLGSSSGDLGWYGKGFYFAFSHDEAATYGGRVIPAYLRMRNPYDYSQLYKFKGSDKGATEYARFAWMYNITKQFPDIAEGQRVWAYPNDAEEGSSVSWKQLTAWMDRIQKEKQFSVKEVELNDGTTAWELRADPKKESFTNEDGDIFEWTEYGMTQIFATEQDAKEPINQIGAYLKNVMGVDTIPRRAIEKIDFSGALQRAGYDGILQSMSGDEAVVFSPEQIKTSEPVTYDDSGNVIPLSERFNEWNNDIRYSERDPELEKVNRVLEKENTELKHDLAYLKELLKLQNQVTGGTKFTKSSVEAAAGQLMKYADAKGNKAELARLLNNVYEYIAGGKELTWDGVKEAAQPAVDWLQGHVRTRTERSAYAQDVLKEIRNSKVYLDEQQKQEVAYQYGSYNEFRKKSMGSVILTDTATMSLDSQWHEWSQQYPNLFDPDISSTDMPTALMEVFGSLRNMTEVDYGYDQELFGQELLSRVYDSYWNVSTLYTVKDKAQKEINRLKFDHAGRMANLKKYHTEQTTKLKQDHRENLQRVRKELLDKAEKQRQDILARHEASRKKGAENRHKAEMRRKIRRTIRDLDKLLNKGDKKRNVKEGMKDLVSETLRSADILFTDHYSNEDMIRNGVGTDLTEQEAKYVEEARELMEQIANLPSGSYEAFQKRQEQESKLQSKLSYRMSKLNDVFARERARLAKAKVSEVLGSLAEAYKGLEDSEQGYISGAFHENVYQYLLAVQGDVGGTLIRDMSMNQLEELHKAYTMVLTTVRNANKMFAANLKQTREQLGSQTIAEVQKAGGEHGLWAPGEDKISAFSWNNEKPVYAFERIGSETLAQLFENTRAGEDIWAKDMTEAREFYLKQASKHKYDSWDFKKQYKFTSTSGIDFSLNLEQIMSLYAYSKREQAHDHLMKGGFVFDGNTEVQVSKIGIKMTYLNKTAKAHNVSPEILGDIVSKLTAEQKAFVDEMQDYLSTNMGGKGNEVSMQMYGVNLFNEKYYFPLRSAGQYMERAKEADLKKQQGQISIVNSGFTKAITPKSSNPVVLSGFMDVWADHVNEMSMYHSFVLPMEDFRRVYNYSSPNMETGRSISVNSVIQDAYGEAATAYIDQLYRDLNGGAVSDPRETTAKVLMGKFKKAAVFASLSVVIQQPSAIGRAFAIISPKYFIGSKVDHKRHKALWAELKQYAPVAIIKEMGYFDTGMGKSAQGFIKGKEYHGLKEKAAALFTDGDYRDEVLCKAPALADELTWCAIWEAAKRETRANNPKMDVKSEEFLQLAGKRFTEVITKTQVYDSVLSRSANMRSKGAFMSMWTAFMAEPTTTINMVEDALRKAKKGDKKYAARAMGAVMTSVVINSLLVSLVYAMRDDDEDETFLEKYVQSFATEILDGINPITYYPFLKDVWSVMQGYDIERSDMSLISSLTEKITKLVQVYSKDTDGMDEDELAAYHKSVSDAWWGVLDYGTALAGIPVKNVRREINGAFNMFRTISQDLTDRDTSWGSLIDKTWDDVKNAIPVVGRMPDTTAADKLYDAIMSGDEVYLARLKSCYKTDSAYQSALSKALRENDPRIKEAAEARFSGDFGKYRDIFLEIKGEGNFTFDVIMGAVNAEELYLEKRLKGDSAEKTTDAEESETLFDVEHYYAAVARNDRAAASIIYKDLIAEKIAEGYLMHEAEDAIATSFATQVGTAYMSGEISRTTAVQLLKDNTDKDETQVKKWDFELKYGFSWGNRVRKYRLGKLSRNDLIAAVMEIEGESREGAEEYIRFLNLEMDNQDIDITANDASGYFEHAEPAGIDVSVYLDFKDRASQCESDKDQNGNSISGSKKAKVLKVIDSLPITDVQKDALYYACNYPASELHNAPWHK